MIQIIDDASYLANIANANFAELKLFKADVSSLIRKPLIGAIGTSSVEMSFNDGGSNGDQIISYEGFLGWLVAMCPQIEMPINYMVGIGGGTSTNILNAIDSLLTKTPKMTALIIQVTGNDAGGLTYETSVANYNLMIAKCVAAGVTPIIVTQHPTSVMSGNIANAQRFLRLVNYIRRLRLISDLCVADFSIAAADKGAATYTYKAPYATDGVHLNKLGCQAVVQNSLKSVIDELFPRLPFEYSIATNADIWTAINNTGSLNENPLMLGSGGTASGSTSGSVATGFSINNTIAGVTVTASKHTDVDGRIWQRLSFAGTPSSLAFLTIDPTFVSGALTSLQVGDLIETKCEYRITSGANKFGLLAIRNTLQETGFADNVKRHGVMTASQVPSIDYDGILTAKTPLRQIRGVVTGASGTRMFLYPSMNVPVDTTGLVVDIGSFVVRKQTV